jgi:hypothetical protein
VAGALAGFVRCLAGQSDNTEWPVRLQNGAQNIPAGQVKMSIGGEGSTADLRCRRGLKSSHALLEAGGAIVSGGLKPQNGGKRTAMNNALPSVSTGLEAQRVDVRAPDTGHVYASKRRHTSI